LLCECLKTDSVVPPHLSLRTVIAALLLVGFVQLLAAQTRDDWQAQVSKNVENQHLDVALAIVDQRLADASEDLKAHGWPWAIASLERPLVRRRS
jgi:hypothetical protein